jgi:hypothetical protein
MGPYARVNFNAMPELTLSPSQGLWISGRKFLVEDSVVGQHWFHADPDAGIC